MFQRFKRQISCMPDALWLKLTLLQKPSDPFTMAEKVTCSRCNGEGHRAAECSKPFLKTCDFCKSVGHTAKLCPALRRNEFCVYCKTEGHTRQTCEKKLQADKARLARLAKAERAKNDDGKSESSETSTTATWSNWSNWSGYGNTKPRRTPVLTEEEEREVRKVEKKLREIAALEDKRAAGEELDVLQLEKLDRKLLGKRHVPRVMCDV